MSYLRLFAVILIASFISCGPTSVNSSSSSILSILINTNWKMQEIRFLQKNIPYYYKRNAISGNNMNFDNDYIKFNINGAGTYHQTDGTEYSIKWQFSDEQKTSIDYVIENFRDNEPLIVHWENIVLNKKILKYTEYYTHVDGTNSLAYAIRTHR